jgi:hypothetical protein
MRKYHYCFLLSVLPLFVWNQAGAQAGLNLSKTYPSPDAASLGNFGLVPATPFSGQADISIPLYQLAYKEMQVPITMRYATGGHRVDDHPGWMGLGWTLQAGGVIVRKVNGIYDEHPREMPNVTYTNEICYYYNCGRVASSFSNLDTIKKYALDGTTAAETIANAYDAMPDEFIFNFNGYSGTFFITRASINAPVEIKVKPNGAYKLKAEIVEMRNNLTFNDWKDVNDGTWTTRQTNRSFYTFRITDENGIQYTFGGNIDAIEFSNNGNLSRNFYTIASAWHLTEMTAPGGNKIQFKYKRAGRVFVQQKQRNALFYDVSYNIGANTFILFRIESGSISYSGSLENIVISVQNPVHLDSINTPLQRIGFSSTKANDLEFPLDATVLRMLTDPDFRFGADKSYWQKLDEINIVGVKKIGFNYRNQTDKRLRLNSINVKNTADATAFSYSFQYNTLDLPAYNSRMADHWGYYNGRSYAYGDNYLTVREPVPQYLVAETLETITYPTGGYLKLAYEPHNYRKIARQFPFVIEPQTANLVAGGLRVRKITAGASSVDTMTKEYFYTENYIGAGANASGVLSGIPQYANAGTRRSSFRHGNFWSGSWGSFSLHYGKIIDNNFLILGNTNGNHVTYSEVTEKYEEGYVVYKYTNHDNGYKDKEPYNIYTNFDSKWHEEGFVSMETFRGLLTKMNYYDKDKNPVRNITYEYMADTVNTYYRVPYFFRLYDESMAGVSLSRVSTCVFYTKPVLMKKQTDTIRVAGTANYIVESRTNRFFPDLYPTAPASSDNYREAEIRTTNSEAQEMITAYTYPFDMVPARDPSGIYQGMLNANMNAEVIEEKKLKGSTQLLLTRTNYYMPFTGLYVPQSIEVQVAGHPIELRNQFTLYDNAGNLLSQAKDKDMPQSFTWDYKRSFPIAEVTNASATGFAYTSFEADGKGNWTFTDTNRVNEGITGNRSFALLPGNSIAFSQTGTGSDFIISYWSKNGQVTIAGATSLGVRTGFTRNGWTLYEHTVRKTATTITLTAAAYTLIDELRLHPVTAEMTTYTYDPVLGKTGECSGSHVITYYNYDTLGRLRFIRDTDGNVIRSFEYKYKQ